MDIRKLKPHEIMEYNNISSVCFEWEHDTKGQTGEEYYQNLLSKRADANNPVDFFLEDCLYGAFTDDHVMTSGIAFIPYNAHFDGHLVKLSGVGGVCTLPEYRRSGGVRAIFQKALNDLYKNGTTLSFLYPFSQAYYEKFGYALSNPSLSFLISLKHVRRFEGGQFSLYRGGDISDFQTAYSKMVRNLMLKREPFQWSWLKRADPFKSNIFAYLMRGDDGQPSGYLIFQKQVEGDRRILDVKELVFDSYISLGRMITFLTAYASDYGFARLRLPLDVNPDNYVTDMVLSASEKALVMNGMHRVVNVEKALSFAAYRGDGEITLKVSDEIIPENNAVFAVTFHNGNAVSIQRTDDSQPDIEMDIRAFSSALLGRYDAVALPALPNVTVHRPQALDKVFYVKPMFITDYF